MCRINEYFSYDDVEDSEIRGETMLKLSTTNFSAELLRLRGSIPEPVKMNCMLIHQYHFEADTQEKTHYVWSVTCST
jgi:hypothetical protein